MSDNTTNVTNERLDMTLDAIIKEKGTKSNGGRKKFIKRERTTAKHRALPTRNSATNNNAVRQRATREASRTQSINTVRGIVPRSTPAIRTRTAAAVQRARLISKRAIQRRQNPAPQVLARRQRTNGNNLKVTFTNTTTPKTNGNNTHNTNTNAHSHRNAGSQGLRLRRVPIRNPRAIIRSPRTPTLSSRLSDRLPPTRRLSLKQTIRQELVQQRRSRGASFVQNRSVLRDRQVAQIRGIQTQQNTTVQKKITLNERFSHASSSSLARNDNQPRRQTRNENPSRGRGVFHFDQPSGYNSNNNGNHNNSNRNSNRNNNRSGWGDQPRVQRNQGNQQRNQRGQRNQVTPGNERFLW